MRPGAPERYETALPINVIVVNNAGVRQAAARLSHNDEPISPLMRHTTGASPQMF